MRSLFQKMEPTTRNSIFRISQDTDPKYKGQNGQQVVLQGEVRYEVQGDEYLDVGHHSQKAGNDWRTRNPPEDESIWEAKAVNGRKDLWMPSLDRECKLEVVRSGSLYDVRAYKGEKKPSRLYNEDDAELQYKLPPEDISPRKTQELEDERQEVIRSQVVRKSTTVAERWSSMDELEAINIASPSKNAAESKRSYSTGFAVCFDNPSPNWVSTPVDPENIDTEQINFAAARQQFLALEKSNPNLLFGSRRQVSSQRSPVMRNIYETQHQSPVVMKDYGDADECSQRGWGGTDEKTGLPSTQRKEPISYGRVIISSTNNLDSNLRKTSPEFSVETTDGQLSRTTSRDLLDSATCGQDPSKELEASDETPIEREIRLAQEREANLWKERGIQRTNSKDELVEIRSKPLLSSSISSLVSSRKGKDTPRVSFNIQREIEQETKREEDLQKEGRLLGTYDKGNLQELGERRKVFEQEEAVPSSSCKPKKLREPPEPLHGEGVPDPSCTDGAKRIAHQNVNQSFEVYHPSSVPDVGQRGPGNEFFSSQSATTYSKQMEPSKPKLSSPQEMEYPAKKWVLRKEHFAIPIWKPKFSFSSDQGPHGMQKNERGSERAVPREELYTLKTWKPRTSVLIDQEIRDALQREEELQEQRRQMGLTLASDTNGPAEKTPFSPLSSQSSVLSGVAGSYSVSNSPVFSPGSPVRLSASSSPDIAHSRRTFSELDMKMHQSSMQLPMEEKKRRQREGCEIHQGYLPEGPEGSALGGWTDIQNRR
ncbi:mitotic interactor and substrate of PLK1 isoform X2 [Tiliqua scincoides]|uniref:mitotic interactor and substrate of PLK1 isoform X2 n=1 Tax=Tiliqua scincoides TaxID=71010 RepID=UPI003461D7B9